MSKLEWIARLESDGGSRYVLLANPSHITVGRLFDVFVIDRAELEYQLRLDSTRVDGIILLDALDNEKLNISLAALVAARSARAAFSSDDLRGTQTMRHQTAGL